MADTVPLCEAGSRKDCTVCRDWPEWIRHHRLTDEINAASWTRASNTPTPEDDRG